MADQDERVVCPQIRPVVHELEGWNRPSIASGGSE